MHIHRSEHQQRQRAPEQNFTGTVWLTMLKGVEEPSCVSCARVTFEAGARTVWHSHPLGQTLLVTEGTGWTQCEGEDIVEIRVGDVIWCPPGHKHWHGAAPGTSMTHVAIQESLNGVAVTWMEPVSEDQYLAGPSGGTQ